MGFRILYRKKRDDHRLTLLFEQDELIENNLKHVSNIPFPSFHNFGTFFYQKHLYAWFLCVISLYLSTIRSSMYLQNLFCFNIYIFQQQYQHGKMERHKLSLLR